MAAPTLDGRLICACSCTYVIAGNGTLDPDAAKPYYEGAGFLNPPVTFAGGPSLIDACLVGITADGVVVAFRGTLHFNIHDHASLLDWLTDFNADPLTVAGFPGQVHQGFKIALDQIWGPITAAVNALRVGPLAASQVLVTGHSKGGSLATLAAWLFKSASALPTTVVTFASPRTGDAAFRDAYNAQLQHTRYEYADDIVPHLPPSEDGLLSVLSSLPLIGSRFQGLDRFDYEHVGTLQFIDWTGGIDDDTPELRAQRNLQLALLIMRLKFSQIGADHAIDCGSGYMTEVCPTGVCENPLP